MSQYSSDDIETLLGRAKLGGLHLFMHLINSSFNPWLASKYGFTFFLCLIVLMASEIACSAWYDEI